MRRLTGMLDNVEVILFEYDNGIVEVPANVRDQLVGPDGTMPMGPALEERCRLLFGDSLWIMNYAPGETPSGTARP